MGVTQRPSPDTLLATACETAAREHDILTTECGAFREFIADVEQLSPDPTTTENGLTAARSITTESSGLRPVRESYQSTVMAVPHYESEYDEPYETNVREELGPDVGTLLTNGQVFEQHHKRAVLTAAEQAIERRRELGSAIATEQQSLEQLREPVCSVVANVNKLEAVDFVDQDPELLDGYLTRLEVLEERCHDLIERRQSGLVNGRRALALPISGPDIPTYLYEDLPRTYPVISTLTESIEKATDCKVTIEAELTHIA